MSGTKANNASGLDEVKSIHGLLNAKETESLRQLWQAGGYLKITGWENRDFDWMSLWEKDYVKKKLIRSGREPIYEIELTFQGQALAKMLFEPVRLCPHCGQPLADS